MVEVNELVNLVKQKETHIKVLESEKEGLKKDLDK